MALPTKPFRRYQRRLQTLGVGPLPPRVIESGGVTPTPVLANLTQVSNALLTSNAAQTWWSEQGAINPAGTLAIQGFTDNTGLQYFAQIDPATRLATDIRRIESPAVYTPDEHQSDADTFLSGGAALFAVNGHSNAIAGTQAAQNRILFSFSLDGTLANMRQMQTFTLSGGDAVHGGNYGQWVPLSATRALYLTNQDTDASWGFINVEIANEALTLTEYRRIARRTPSTRDGEDQLYGFKAGLIGPTTLRVYFQFHASNTRNIIQAFNIDLTTGVLTGAVSGTVYGNVFDLYSAGPALVNFAVTGNPEPFYDPGVGKSVRLLDAVGAGIGGVYFDSSNGGNPQHFWYEGGVMQLLGDPGTALDTGRRYFRGMVRARESHSGYRWYRCYTDGTKDYLEKIEAASLGGALTRTPYFQSAGPAQKVLRPFPFQNATSALAISVAIGSYSDYTSFTVGMQFFNQTQPTQPVVGTLRYRETFAAGADGTLLTAGNPETPNTATYSKSAATGAGTGDVRKAAVGRSYVDGAVPGTVIMSAPLAYDDIDVEITISRLSSTNNVARVGVGCDVAAMTGMFPSVNNASGAITLAEFVNGTPTTRATLIRNGGTQVNGDKVVWKRRKSGSNYNWTLFLNGIQQTLTFADTTTGQTYVQTAAPAGNYVQYSGSSAVNGPVSGVGFDLVEIYSF